MKKNKMLRLASVLMVCVLLTISVISGTYAKYTTVAEVSDSARVAKWGVTFTTTSDLFATSYKDPTDNTVTVKVTATDNKNLVAPGTEGTGFGVTTSGDKPEVSYNMTIELDTDNSKMPKLTYTPTGDGATETTYEPVKFTILNGSTELAADKTFSQLKDLLVDASGKPKPIYTYDVATGKYTVDTNLDGSFTGETAGDDVPNIKIKWKWAIDTGTDDSTKAFNTKLDTILGDIAAGLPVTNASSYKLPTGIALVSTATGANNTDVDFTCTMTATQID